MWPNQKTILPPPPLQDCISFRRPTVADELESSCSLRSIKISFHGFQWVLSGFTGCQWVLLDFIVFHKVLIGLGRFDWVSLGFTGFYWVLLGFTGFYWVLLGFTGNLGSLVFFWVLNQINWRYRRVLEPDDESSRVSRRIPLSFTESTDFTEFF